jgi:exosome complex exonuclease RRP6
MIKLNLPIKPSEGYLLKKCFSNGFNMISKEQKPQSYFRDKVDNTNLPFIPKIRVKPNAIKPLQG